MNSEDPSPDMIPEPADSDETAMIQTEEPSPEISSAAVSNDVPATLAQMVITAQAGRMSPAAETQAADLLRTALLGGKPEISDALDAIAKLPWPISVNGLNAAWPEMKPYGRRLFVSGMKGPAFEGEIGRRIRLSITRGLVKVDETQAAKWACAISAEMLGEDGILTTRDRQSFFNVLVGKGKPWLLRLNIDGLKDADLAHLLDAGISTIFTGGCPPFTQSALLLWLMKIEKLEVLSERSQQAVSQAIRKWPGRLMRDFRTLSENLPEAIAAAFAEKNDKRSGTDNQEPEDKSAISEESGDASSLERPIIAEAETDDDEDAEDGDEEDEDDEPEDDEETVPRERRDQRPQHPPYISPGQPNRPAPTGRSDRNSERNDRGGAGNFDPVTTLRQLDQFIRQQAQQLSQARIQLRQRDDEMKRGGGGKRGRGGRSSRYGADNVWPDTTPPEDNESLRRYVAQLEGVNSELRARLEDLAQDGERRVQSMVAPDGTPLGERDQLVEFLSLKLGKDHADFLKLASEPDDEVFREHYRIVAQNVFEILAVEGIYPKPPEVPQVDLG